MFFERKFLSLHTVAAMLLILTGCNGLMSFIEEIFPTAESGEAETVVEVQSANPVLEAVYKNLEAGNEEDLEKYMSTIHPDSFFYTTTRRTMENLFATYDLNYDLTEVAVIEQTDTEARVSFTLVTTRLSGPAFNDNIVTGIFILRLDGDVWKFYDQTVENVEYINP